MHVFLITRIRIGLEHISLTVLLLYFQDHLQMTVSYTGGKKLWYVNS